ncbi:MAG: hypothetical protein J6U54_16130 [Clostridiales bacterium]|nr:hypothetical protein [Clostridiales bacterium]
MNKGIKIALNILFGTGVGAAGYFVGYKRGQKKAKEWAMGEINAILEDKNKEIDVLQSEQIADLEKLTPDILSQMEYGKEDKVTIEDKPEPITPAPLDTQEIDIPDPVPAKKSATRKKPRKTPFLIDDVEFDENSDGFDRVDLSMDQYGDLYDDDSEDLYEYPEYIGDSLIKRMLKDIEFGDAKQWFVKNEQMNTVFDITYRMITPV